jgi:hypothetical protein
MRRVLISVTVVSATLLVFASPTLAQPTGFEAMFREQLGAAPFKQCPTGGDNPCGVGRIMGLGKATERFVLEGEPEEVDSCIHFMGTTTITLQDGSGSLLIAEEETECSPGNAGDAPGNQLHSFGNPAKAEGTWAVTGGTGVFAGASGGGTLSFNAAGDALIIMYSGTISLP